MSDKKAYLIIYMASFFLMGIPLSSIGSLIPFFAQDLGIEQTEYSILFILLSVGSVSAALLYKFLNSTKKLPSHHILCLISSIIIIIVSVLMANASTKFMQCLLFSIFGMFAFVEIISINICLLLAPPKEDVGQWVSFSHGFFGVGALIGPIIVSYLQKNMFVAIAIAFAATAPFFYFLSSPQQNDKEIFSKNQQKKISQTMKKLQTLISLAFLIVVGIEVTIAAWIPTYAVLKNIENKQKAVRFASIFWAMSTAFRFILGYLKTKDSIKFRYLLQCQVVTGITCTILGLVGWDKGAVYICSIFYGISMSLLFPLLLSLSIEFDIKFSDSQISNMMIWPTISSGVFAPLTGELMKIDINMFFYSLLGFTLLLFWSGNTILSIFLNERINQKEKNEQQLSLVQN